MATTTLTQAQSDLRSIAGILLPGEKTKTVIDRVSALVGLSYWRTFDLWYGKARRVEDYEIEKIQNALARKELERLENDVQNWRTALAKADAKIAQIRADIARPRLDLFSHDVRREGRPPRK